MRQLTRLDASFLYSDTVHTNANVSFVQIYDQSTAPGGLLRFKTILAHIASRLHRTPIFRSKLLRVPLELDYPYWVEDEHFDLEYHVRHIALPKPGDWRQFCIQASRIHARALDRNRPLWEIYVIEGLDSVDGLPVGSFALLIKVHHAAVDFERRNEIVEALHDLDALPATDTPPEPWFPERAPRSWSLMAQGAVHTALSPLRLLDPLKRLAPTALSFAKDLLHGEHQAATRFNSVVSPHRVFDTRRFLLDELERIRALVPGASVDDVVLAVCGGGLRRYLEAHGELPAADLAALTAPSSPGPRDQAAGLAQTPPGSKLRVELGTCLADPLERLASIHRQTMAKPRRAGKSKAAGPVADPRHHDLPTCTVINLASSAQPLYLAGARMTYCSALLPIADGMGLVFAVTRYDGRVIVSPTSCRELMPDPQAFTQCIRDSFQEYLALAEPRPAVQRAAELPRSPRTRVSASGRRSPPTRKARTDAIAPRPAPDGRRRSTAPRR